MIAYPHFASPNLYLLNGFREVETPYGIAREYFREDELEQCVRRILLRKPERLRGRDLRFLRNGLDLTQTQFGEMVDRDAQTVARWEKSFEPIPTFVDLTIRARFAAKFELGMELEELLSYVDGTAPKLPGRILLALTDTGWEFNLQSEIKSVSSKAHADSFVQLPGGYGLLVKVLTTEQHSGAVRAPDQDVKVSRIAEGSAVIKLTVDTTPSSESIGEMRSILSEFTASGTSYVRSNSTVH